MSDKLFDGDIDLAPAGEAYLRCFRESNVWENMAWHGVPGPRSRGHYVRA